MENGDWVKKAVDLSGGTEINFKISNEYSTSVENELIEKYGVRSRISRSIEGESVSLVGAQESNSTEILEFVRSSGVIIEGEPSIQSIGPALGSSFWNQAQLAILLGFILMGISIYAIYRSIVPSLAMILSAATSMIETIAIMNLLGIELSLAGIAALLMMIGYAVDTNVVLTTRLLKREVVAENFDKTLKSSMVTGLTMSATSIAALLAMIVFSPASVITQIASVLVIGLIFDIPNTWIQNSTILRWHLNA